jgi:2-haloacid dehalogenase
VLDLSRFSVLSFDCYGTLIDWETGLWSALQAVLAHHDVAIGREAALELHGELETATESGPYRSYRAVLATVLDGFGQRLGFAPTAEERERFAASVGGWPAFPDTVAALRALQRRYRLAILSNVDDDLFAATARRLRVPFDWVITAQQLGSYKPAARNFELAIERIGVGKERQLHVAQSLFHDIAPARALGLATVWVNRRRGLAGPGATPPAAAVPDLEVPDLATLAARAAT